MQRKASRWFQRLCVACLVLCLGLVAQAQNKDGRSFGGDYKILQATEQGDNMEVRVWLRVINNTGTDVQDATIWLASSLMMPPGGDSPAWVKEQLPFKNVTLHFNEHKIVPPLIGTFTIPTQEYEQWRKAPPPNFMIAYRDASGAQRQQRIALAPAP